MPFTPDEAAGLGLAVLDPQLPLLFLDFDGVIATEQSYQNAHSHPVRRLPSGFSPDAADDAWLRGCSRLDGDLCRRVQGLCTVSRAQIVVISAWRQSFSAGDLQVMLARKGLHAPLVGVTPTSYGYPSKRGSQIQAWIDMQQFDKVPPLVVLEDMEDVSPYTNRQVQTCFDGPDAGFQDAHYRAALNLYHLQGAVSLEEVLAATRVPATRLPATQKG